MTIIRKLTGFATTQAVDSSGDRVIADGVKFRKFPLPLLAAHKTDMPIGTVVGAKRVGDGYVITAYLFPPGENTDADNFATAARHGAAAAFSIGFLTTGKRNEFGGRDLTTSDVYEVSLVIAPCNQECRATYTEYDDGKQAAPRTPARVKPQPNKPMSSATDASKRTDPLRARKLALMREYEAEKAARLKRIQALRK